MSKALDFCCCAVLRDLKALTLVGHGGVTHQMYTGGPAQFIHLDISAISAVIFTGEGRAQKVLKLASIFDTSRL